MKEGIHALLFCILLAVPLSASTKQTYTVLLVGNRAGMQTTEVEANGGRSFHYEFNDRGRGPKVDVRMRLNDAGVPVRVEIAGNDYYKRSIEEQLDFQNGKARWKSTTESGEKTLDGNAFYISVNGVPEELGILAAALLKAKEQKIALLPEGEARIEHAGDLEIKSKAGSRTVSLYAITGLYFLPVSVWLNEDRSFFASVDTWLTTIPEGWEDSVPVLLKTQEQFSSKRFTTLSEKLTHRPGKRIAIEHANLFDAETAEIRNGMTVVLNGNRIESIGPDEKIAVPAEALAIDATGQTLMPGLWDMHVHVVDLDGLLQIAAGVTSVRDLANETEKAQDLKKQFDSGSLIGPRMVLAGFIDGPGPYAGPSKVLVANEQEARAAVDRYAELGYEQIKIYSSVKPELVPAIIDEARKKQLRVSGHIPAFMTAEQAVKLGYDEIQHANFLFLNFLADTVQDTRTPVRFSAVAEHAVDLDLSSQRVNDFVQLLKERKTVVDPTVNVFESLFLDRPGIVSRSFVSVADRFPPQVRRSLLTGGIPVPEGKDQRYQDSFATMLRMIKKLYEAGIPMVAGTDSLAGFGLHRELELYVEAGIPAAKVLQLATLGSARVMKRDAQLGSIAPGKMADLILLDGNPAENISDIRKVRTVFKDGKMFSSAEIYEAIGISQK